MSWGVGVSVYFLAVFHRSSLGVAGLLANQRFDISAAQLSTFTMLQLLVYAGMQVPVGLLVDRFGSRSVLLGGLTLMSLAQAGFAVSTDYPAALVARIFVGMGDAMTFISVIRLVSSWFPLRRVPLLTQVTGFVGQSGAIVAAIPLSWALGRFGWTQAYLTAACIGPVVAVVLLLFLHDAPSGRNLRGIALSFPELRATLRASWAQPGTRLGFWIHFATPISSNVLALLWGFPFLVRGEGMSHGDAAVLLTVLTATSMVAGPVLGWFAGRHPWHRSTSALVILAAMMAAWAAVLAFPGDAPPALLVVLIVVCGVGGPMSVMGFDVGRTSNPVYRLASSTGIINQAGFTASLLTVMLIGWILDWRTPGGSDAYTPGGFHWAMGVQYVFWVLGLVQILRYRWKVRSRVTREQVQSGTSMVEHIA